VAGHDRGGAGQEAALGQLFVCEQRGRDDQRLGHRGVGDLLGGRRGAQLGEIETADLRPGGQTVRRTGQL